MTTTRRPSTYTLAAAMLLVATPCLFLGCAEEGGKGGGAATNANGPSEVPSPKEVPSGYATDVTEAEAAKFAQELEQAFQTSDQAAVTRLIDWQRLADRACNGLDVPAAELRQMKTGLVAGISGNIPGSGGVVSEIIRNVSAGGDYAFVRTDEKDGIQRAVFRLVTPEGAMNYHAYTLVRNRAGEVVASDIYIQATAEFLSQTMRKIMFSIIASRPNSFLERLTGADRDWMEAVDTFPAITQARNEGRHTEVMRLCGKLPESIQKSKAILLMKVMSAQHLDEQVYMQVMQDFQKQYPNDPALAMVSIDYYFLKGDYDKVLDTIDQLDKEISDPYLCLYRANANLMKGDLPNARKHADQFVAKLPKFMSGHECLATVAAKQGDFPAVTKALKVLYREFQIDPRIVANLPDFASYKASEEYQELEKELAR